MSVEVIVSIFIAIITGFSAVVWYSAKQLINKINHVASSVTSVKLELSEINSNMKNQREQIRKIEQKVEAKIDFYDKHILDNISALEFIKRNLNSLEKLI